MEIKYDRLEENVETLQAALCLEALHAARDIRAEPSTARGGPWSKPGKLSAAWLSECTTVAGFRSFNKLGEYAKLNVESPLGAHLADVRFKPADGHDTVGCRVRGALITRYRKSGRSKSFGNARRTAALDSGALKRGTKKLRRAHRGVKPVQRRCQENKRAKTRREEKQLRVSFRLTSLRRLMF